MKIDLTSIAQLNDKYPQLNLVFLTIALVIIYIIVNYLILSTIRKNEDISEEDQLASVKRVKNYGKLILIIGIFSLWFAQLQSVFVSLIVFASAIVLALKEVIMCITGGFLTKINKQFKVGDRIEVDSVRGYVLEKTLTGTKILEFGPEKYSQQTTGNIISIPNSLFLNKTAINLSYFQDFSIRSFIFSPLDNTRVLETETILLDIANRVSKSYLKKATESISKFCKREGIVIPAIEPRVKLLISETNEVKLQLKMPVDNIRSAQIEQSLYREFIVHFENKSPKS